jgi:two-component system sensor histidine kinase YesM
VDNGVGVSPERLAEALAGPQERHHGLTSIGLDNIRRRIALNHGNGFGVELTSRPGTGTVALLRLPVIHKE